MTQEEINELSTEDLNERLEQQKEQLDKMRMTHAVSPLENPLQIRYARKVIARIKTELTKRSKVA